MTDDDPTRHMDLGETKTITTEKTLHGINFAPNEYFGSGVQSDNIRVSDVKVVEPEREGDLPNIKTTWSAEVTKQLGRRWDEHDEPVTDTERKQARRRQWLQRWSTFAVTGVILALTTVISTRVMNTALGQMTINGEPMTAPTTGEMLPLVLVVFVLAAMIWYGLQGGFPGKVGGKR